MQEFRFLNLNARKATKFTNNVDAVDSVLDELTSRKAIGKWNFVPGDIPVANPSLHGYLKFVLLFGLFTLEGTQQAVAGSDFTSGLQSMPFLGDLGDISTGFASVRIISLQHS